MAAAKKPPAEEGPRPTADEVARAIEEWRAVADSLKTWHDAETAARVKLVDVLHRAGIKGIVL